MNYVLSINSCYNDFEQYEENTKYNKNESYILFSSYDLGSLQFGDWIYLVHHQIQDTSILFGKIFVRTIAGDLKYIYDDIMQRDMYDRPSKFIGHTIYIDEVKYIVTERYSVDAELSDIVDILEPNNYFIGGEYQSMAPVYVETDRIDSIRKFDLKSLFSGIKLILAGRKTDKIKLNFDVYGTFVSPRSNSGNIMCLRDYQDKDD